jgi:predicted HTH domain antitoxin
METVSVKLERPIQQFVEHQSEARKVTAQEMVSELVSLGFERLVEQNYEHYRQGRISFGHLAQEMGITTWELSHLLEERGWPAHNLPEAS